MNRRKLLLIILLHVFLPLLIGLSIYLLYKPALFPSMSISGYDAALYHKNFFIKLLVNSGPDFCWSYSFASALFITNFILFKNKLLVYVTVFVIILAEVIQFFLPSHFTFDRIDLFVAIMAVILSYYVIKLSLNDA